MLKTLRARTTKRLDGRSALAVAVRCWKKDIRRNLGGDLSRAQETVLEAYHTGRPHSALGYRMPRSSRST